LSTGSFDNLGDTLGTIEFVSGDARNFEVVERAVRGVDAVVHLVALIDVAESVKKRDL